MNKITFNQKKYVQNGNENKKGNQFCNKSIETVEKYGVKKEISPKSNNPFTDLGCRNINKEELVTFSTTTRVDGVEESSETVCVIGNRIVSHEKVGEAVKKSLEFGVKDDVTIAWVCPGVDSRELPKLKFKYVVTRIEDNQKTIYLYEKDINEVIKGKRYAFVEHFSKKTNDDKSEETVFDFEKKFNLEKGVQSEEQFKKLLDDAVVKVKKEEDALNIRKEDLKKEELENLVNSMINLVLEN